MIPTDALPVLSLVGSVGVISAALALGLRHGIDWDHIAAITDITSTTAELPHAEKWLIGEPGFMLTDESHHSIGHSHGETGAAVLAETTVRAGHIAVHTHAETAEKADGGSLNGQLTAMTAFVTRQRSALLLGSLYALGHGSVVFVLGVMAIVAREFLPDWIDPVMERVVGVTLILLALYLFYAIFRFFRSGEEVRLRSRWMLVFSAVRNAYEGIRARVFGKPREHVHAAQQYGARTALGIGAIHGVGAETGTQVLVITTAVGASSQAGGVIALLAFIAGLLISNTAITVVSTVTVVSSSRRQWIYVTAGGIAAILSLVVGVLFLAQAGDLLPNLDRLVSWIGGPD
jgi:high-affinity nickel-transport protein